MLCLGKKIFHSFCDLFCHLRVEAAFPEHLICNQIGHTFQQGTARTFRNILPCAIRWFHGLLCSFRKIYFPDIPRLFNRNKSFSRAKSPVSCNFFFALRIVHLHGCDIIFIRFSIQQMLCVSRFSAAASTQNQSDHSVSPYRSYCAISIVSNVV